MSKHSSVAFSRKFLIFVLFVPFCGHIKLKKNYENSVGLRRGEAHTFRTIR
jgi:hypothetical protein